MLNKSSSIKGNICLNADVLNDIRWRSIVPRSGIEMNLLSIERIGSIGEMCPCGKTAFIPVRAFIHSRPPVEKKGIPLKARRLPRL